MPSATLTSKGQITIPKPVRDRLGLATGDVLEFTVADDGSIRIRPPARVRDVVGVLRDVAPPSSVSVEEMKTAVRRRVGRERRGE